MVEKQEFNLGDIVYCFYASGCCFKGIITGLRLYYKTIEYQINNNEISFYKEDIGKYVFRTKEDRDKNYEKYIKELNK